MPFSSRVLKFLAAPGILGLLSCGQPIVSLATPPGAPLQVIGSPGNARVAVAWSAPASDGGEDITGYAAVAVEDSTRTCATAGTLGCTVAGLANGIAYSFVVRALNRMGAGPASLPSAPVTPGAVPGAPTAVAAVAGNGEATVSWAAPASDGGSALTGYKVTAVEDTSRQCTTAIAFCTVTGLTNGTAYTFTVTAANVLGSGPASLPSAPVTPAAVPGAPTAVAAAGGNAQATVSWAAPSSNGGSALTGYTVTAVGDTTKSCATTGALACVVTGLANGTAYAFTVRASNVVGMGLPSSPSAPVIPATVPGAPTAVAAVGGNAQATVSWTAPSSNGGSALTGYTVTAVEDPAKSCVTATASCTVTDLANGASYTFTVRASNAIGMGPPSAPSAAVTLATVPGAPTTVMATGGDAQATVSWAAPSSNGGSALTGYTVTAAGDTTKSCATTGALSCIVTGLTNGAAYTFTVRASNVVGMGPPSPPSPTMMPATVPGAPTAVTAVGGNARATVSWTAPASNGGLAVTDYYVTASPGGQACYSPPSPNLSCMVTGLTNGTAYTFTVRAANAAGIGEASLPSAPVTPLDPATALPGPTWTPRTSGTANNIHAVVWNGSQLTAVGVGGTALTSPDGLTWTPHAMGSTAAFTGVVWTGTQFVASGSGGAIRTSPDGATWTGRATGTTSHLYNLAWTGSQVVTVGVNGAILTSPDGVTWTPRASGVTGTFYNVEWTGSLMVAVGAGGMVRTSPDGVAWTARNSGATGILYGTTWTGGQVVAVGAGGAVRTSPDGINWSGINSGTTSTLYAAAQVGDRLIYVGASGALYTSDGGADGVQRSSGTGNALYGVAWTGTRAAVVGVNGVLLASP